MSEQLAIVKVGIADMNIVEAPGIIRTCGLGSCVGVVLYSNIKAIAGLAHIMLPESSLAKSKEGPINKAKFADTAIIELVNRLEAMGVPKNRLRAKIAGGAQMFQFNSTSDIMRIGPRNVEAVKVILAALKIAIDGEDIGGSSGRTIEFSPETNKLTIRAVNKPIKVI